MGSEQNAFGRGLPTTHRVAPPLATGSATPSSAPSDHPSGEENIVPQRVLTPLTLDTVLTVDNLQRLLKIVSYS